MCPCVHMCLHLCDMRGVEVTPGCRYIYIYVYYIYNADTAVGSACLTPCLYNTQHIHHIHGYAYAYAAGSWRYLCCNTCVPHLCIRSVRSPYAHVDTSVSYVLSYARGCCPVALNRSRCREKVCCIIVLHLNNSMRVRVGLTGTPPCVRCRFEQTLGRLIAACDAVLECPYAA